MSAPIKNPPGPCHRMHVNHTHGVERPGMPVHCSYCGKIAIGHKQRMTKRAAYLATHKEGSG